MTRPTDQGSGNQPHTDRGGETLTDHMVGDVRVRITIGHLDRMPRCAQCGRALCSHTDAEFAGASK